MIDLNELKNLENSIRECARDLHSMLPEDAEHLPEELKKVFDPWNEDNTVLNEYLQLKEIKHKLFDLAHELSEMIDDKTYED